MYSKKVKRLVVKSKPFDKRGSLVRVDKRKDKCEESSMEESLSTENESVLNQDTQYQYLNQKMCNLTQNVYEMSRNMTTPRQSSNMSSEIIPEFHPEKKHHCVMRWLNKIEELKQIYRWNDLITTYYTTSRLRGLGKVWYESLPSVVFTWEFGTALKIRPKFMGPNRITAVKGEKMGDHERQKATSTSADKINPRVDEQEYHHGNYEEYNGDGNNVDDMTEVCEREQSRQESDSSGTDE